MNPAQTSAFVLPPPAPAPTRVAGYRTRLRIVMMLVVSGVTALALYFAERSLTTNVERGIRQQFLTEFDSLERAREVRYAALIERCRALARKPRIRAALEEAPEVLYLNADDEVRDMAARYRFLNRDGRVIPLPRESTFDRLRMKPEEEAQFALPKLPDKPQVGYSTTAGPGGGVSEIVATPILSSETGEPMAALVMEFPPFALGANSIGAGVRSAILLERAGEAGSAEAGKPQLFGTALPASEDVRRAARASLTSPQRINVDGVPYLLFAKRLNPASSYPPAMEICAYPLADLVSRQRQLRWQVLGAGLLLLLVGLAASHVASIRLSAPVEKLALDSERSARFSADASHQLKTPVTVLRAGLEELLANENLTPEECHQISALIHQTYRLSSLIEDLLLLSRMDAGRLKLEFSVVDLSHLIEASLDDLSALPDDLEVRVETDFPSGLRVAGEERYTRIILQNLFENARKYNRRGGSIRIAAVVEGDFIRLTVGNTGRPIPAAAREHIFERFHRGAMGENVPGYGLGLNLARELARQHRGDLRLTRSDEAWTEFDLVLPLAHHDQPAQA